MPELLEVERDYIQTHHKELSEKYPDKYLVIQGCSVHSQAESFEAGANWGMANLEGDFLVRHVDHPEDEEILVDLSALAPQDSGILGDYGRSTSTQASGRSG